jgi:gluconolactonase
MSVGVRLALGCVLAVAACGGGAAPATTDGGGDTAADSGSAGSAAGSDGGGASAGAGGGDAAVEAATTAADGGDAAADVTADATTVADAAADGGVKTLGGLYCPTAAGAYPNPLATAVQASQVAFTPPGGIMFLEGPVWLAERGVLLLSEWNGSHRILQLTPPQTVEVFLPASRTNGLALAPDGKSLFMVREAPGTSVSRMDLADKSIQPLVEGYEGQPFVQPNDLVVRTDGTIFFTDYQAGRLYRRGADGKLTIVSSLAKSNGVGLSPDERTLYLNADARTVRYPIAADGTVGAGSDLTTGLRGADGLAIDCAGNVYIAQNDGGAVVVVSAAGAKLGEIGGLPKAVTNAAFGGPNRRTLYITTSSALYAAELPIPGLPY